jgi:pyrimidine-nucleoside phosphorylase
MNFLSLIESKRNGEALKDAQLEEIVKLYTAGELPDYQMAALLMAIYFRGLNTAEITALTLAMRDSGDVLEFPKDHRPLVDKHSSGGVGDKVSLPLAPLLACLGFRVPMISGRGLGITGGTLDKLDSIPGFQTLLPPHRIIQLVQSVGCVICGQTDRMVPADRLLYALRDVTATVPSIPLIVASILSKKLAESLDALVLDVKYGTAAFMQTKAEARQLAKAMVALGGECGVKTHALLTRMDVPVGRAAGNWLEVKESVACLDHAPLFPEELRASGGAEDAGNVDAPIDDLRLLVLECAAHLLVQTGRAKSLTAARREAEACLRSGAPRGKFDEMLAAQGADRKAFAAKLALDHTAPVVRELKSERAGFVSRCDAQIIGEVIRDLGGGRITKESVIDYDVGVDRIMKPGERVEVSGVLCRIHASEEGQAGTAAVRLQAAFSISPKQPGRIPLVTEIIR